jgi:hypothetical protein
MEDEDSRRRWALHKSTRIEACSIDAWLALQERLSQNIGEFNREFEAKKRLPPVSLEGSNAFIAVRKDGYPLYAVEITCDPTRKAFSILVRTAPDSVTEPTERTGKVTLDIDSDDNFCLTFRGKQRNIYEIADALTEDVFAACLAR